MENYYKLISKQDETRSFVVNRRACHYFFNIPNLEHGNEFNVQLKYLEHTETTKIVTHQDVRILLKSREFKAGEIAYFKKIKDGIFELQIISNSDQVQQIKNKLNSKNFYLSNKPINYEY
jgi:hypothetical protein